MQTHSPLTPQPLTQPLATLFGPRAPEAALRHAQADLAACRIALRNGSKTFLAASFFEQRVARIDPPAAADRALLEIDRGDLVDEQEWMAVAHEAVNDLGPVAQLARRRAGRPQRLLARRLDDGPLSINPRRRLRRHRAAS